MIKKVDRAAGPAFQVYGRAAGKKVYVGTYESKREAIAAEEDHRVTQRKIESGELAPEHDEKKTFKEGVDAWLESLEANKSRSHGSYTTKSNLYILPTFGGVLINRVTKPMVIRWRDEQSRQFAATTVNSSLTALSSAFSYFVDQGWCPLNPCHEVKPIKTKERVYEWIKTREEITRLLAECHPNIRDIVALALGTGMRIDELLHLQWADVDLPNRLISVHRGRQGTTKSGKARHVPILDSMLTFLRALALKRGGSVLVFQGFKKGKPRTKPGVTVPFKEAAARAGLPPALRFHDLRHTFASHWVLNQGDIFRLSKILGHADVTVTQKFYAHLIPEAWEQDYARVSFVIPKGDERDTAPVSISNTAG
jgi:integrase